jgi:hypothetical protein
MIARKLEEPHVLILVANPIAWAAAYESWSVINAAINVYGNAIIERVTGQIKSLIFLLFSSDDRPMTPYFKMKSFLRQFLS